MYFLIADTFTESLTRLTADEQKAVKTTAFDLQLNPANPSMNFHKLDRAKDKNFWSVRVSSDIRLIVHKSATSLLLCYVDHHNQAYDWAGRRKLETHPKTGAAQLVEIRETVQEITIPKYIEVLQPKPPLFAHIAEDVLLSYGVPQEWLADVQHVNEDNLLILADHLPSEAAEVLLELATGGMPYIPKPVAAGTAPFDHPDAQRRFRVMTNVEELQCALDYPWEKWTIFLHPAQRQMVEKDYSGPARVSGSAGTGKTIVALHRAVYLARNNPDARVLLTTFSDILAKTLRTKLWQLTSSEPRLSERLEVYAMNTIAERLYERHFGRPNIAPRDMVKQLLKETAASVPDLKFSLNFLLTEWEEMVDAWQLDSWEGYRDVKRLGRKTRLSESHRATLWSIFAKVHTQMETLGVITYAGIFSRLAETPAISQNTPFEFVVVDESQDISVAQLRFLAALCDSRPNSLFFAGDLGQRIFQQLFSWKSLGVDIRGRSRTLHINYRTSHQIRKQADMLLGPELSDVDGNAEDRRGTVSVFNGPAPAILSFDSQPEEIDAVSDWLIARKKEGVMPHEIGIFVRSEAELERAREAVIKSGMPLKILDEYVETTSGKVIISTMHLAKGLEFRAVVVMACDDEVIPLQERIETVADETDLEEVYNTERQLLYVACTRARDYLLVTSVNPSSEFLDDLRTTA